MSADDILESMDRFFANNRHFIVIGVLVALVFVGAFLRAEERGADQSATTATGTPTAFVMEVYDTVDKNFWKDISKQQLTNIFSQGITQLTEADAVTIANKEELRQTVSTTLADMESDQRRQFPAELADLVLRSLPPQGRSRLYTQKKEQELANRINNVNPDRNLYDILDVASSSSAEEIQSAYEHQQQELATQPAGTSTQQQLEQLDYAKKVLTDNAARKQYDMTKAEPTVFIDRLSDDIVHLAIHRYNRDTLTEFSQAVQSVSMQPEPSSLILDLRSNIGGSIGILPYLLGPFIGPDRETYRFFQQGEKEPYRTKAGWLDDLVPYKKVVILVDEKTQSTGELMASVLKKYNVGVVVGETTRGWGTVERVFSLDNQYRNDRKYSLFLVHHLTLRGDGQPIQDRGVVPEVAMSESGWRQTLRSYIPDQQLIQAVADVWNQSPPGTQLN